MHDDTARTFGLDLPLLMLLLTLVVGVTGCSAARSTDPINVADVEVATVMVDVPSAPAGVSWRSWQTIHFNGITELMGAAGWHYAAACSSPAPGPLAAAQLCYVSGDPQARPGVIPPPVAHYLAEQLGAPPPDQVLAAVGNGIITTTRLIQAGAATVETIARLAELFGAAPEVGDTVGEFRSILEDAEGAGLLADVVESIEAAELSLPPTESVEPRIQAIDPKLSDRLRARAYSRGARR